VNEELRELAEKIRRHFEELPSHYGFIGYVFDNSPEGRGIGFYANADEGDALVAIIKIIQGFNLDKDGVITCILNIDD